MISEGITNMVALWPSNQKQPSRGVLKKMFWKYAANMQENTHAEVWFQLYLNHTLAWVLSCKFVAYFQNTFSLENL